MKEIPKYMVIANQLRQSILSGDFEDTGQLPQENRLTTAYNVSRITIRKALDVLVAENLIYRIQGAGTFIKDLGNTGRLVNQNQAELLDIEEFDVDVGNFSVIKPDENMAKIIEINKFDFVYMVERILSKKEVKIAYQKLYLPIKYVQGMRLDVLNTSITTFLSEELGIDITAITRSFSIDNLSEQDAKKLNVLPNEKLLTVREKMYLKNGAIGIYNCTWINTKMYDYNTKLVLD
jgi:DNA-binding GntR family transcriptional regulator